MNTKIKKNKYLILKTICLLGILFFSSFLYFYNIEKIPSGLGLDEVPNGYNAYSLLMTGKDEYGKLFPISFKFSGSYSPPLYTYLTVPAVALFGVNIASVRIISVISGVFSIMVVFILLKNLSFIHNRGVVYFATFLYAISPWVVMYSRSGYEAMLSFLIYTLGILFVWQGFRKPIFLTLGIIILSISVYASYANKFLIPLLCISIILAFKDILLTRKNSRYLIMGFIGALIVQIPNLSLIFTKSFFVKGTLFYSQTLFAQYQDIKNILPIYIGIPYLFVREFLSQYLNYFSLRSLFLDPDPFLGRSIPGLSVFYPWMFIPYLIGLYIVWKNRRQINYRYLLLLTVIAPIPAAFTKDPFWTYRAIPLLVPLIAIIAIGINQISKLRTRLFIPLCCLISVYSLLFLWKGYFVFLPNERASAWQYGYQDLTKQVMINRNDRFVIDNTRSSLTYLQLAFFMRISPQLLQNTMNNRAQNDYYNNSDFNSNRSFENVEIRSIVWTTDIYKDQILVGDSLTFSDQQIKEHELSRVFQIKDSLNNIVFEGYRTSPLKKCISDKVAKHILSAVCKNLL